ncbi:hypothetical protein GS432_03440 [Rhodococcus hoagii]|nr:hypothetical protein [Prescottella equi]
MSGLLGAVSGELVRRVGLQRAWTMSDRGGVRRDRPPGRGFPPARRRRGGLGAVRCRLHRRHGSPAVWSTRVYPTHPATGVGLAFLLVAVGQAAAAPVLGFVADRAGLTTSFWMSAGVALAAVAVTPPARFRRT